MEQVEATYELVLEGQRQPLRLKRSGDRARVELAGKALEVDVSQFSEGT